MVNAAGYKVVVGEDTRLMQDLLRVGGGEGGGTDVLLHLHAVGSKAVATLNKLDDTPSAERKLPTTI